MSQLYLTTFSNCIQDTKRMHHTSVFGLFLVLQNANFSELPGASLPPALCPLPAKGLTAPPDPQLYRAMTFSHYRLCLRHNSAQFGTIDHIQPLHKFPYIYLIFLLLLSYNTLHFYLKLPINYPIFCSEYACRPVKYIKRHFLRNLYEGEQKKGLRCHILHL